MRKLFLLPFALFIIMAGNAQTVDLKLNLEKGKEYKQKFNSTIKIIQEFGGQKMEILMDLAGNMTYTVLSIDENGYGIESKYEKLSMKMEMPQGTIEYSSEIDNLNDYMSTFMKKITDIPFEFTLSKTGKVTEVKSIEELWRSLLSQFDQLDEAKKEELLAQLNNAYGEKSFKGNLEMSTAIYPDYPVNKGDKWTVVTDLESTFKGNMTTEYSFVDFTNDYALLKGNAKLTTFNKDEYTESNGMMVKYDLSGTMLSDIKVDLASGWVKESKINQEINGIISIKDNDMTIQMHMVNNMTITN